MTSMFVRCYSHIELFSFYFIFLFYLICSGRVGARGLLVHSRVDAAQSRDSLACQGSRKQKVITQLGPASEGVELWLFHGTNAVNQVLERGFLL